MGAATHMMRRKILVLLVLLAAGTLALAGTHAFSSGPKKGGIDPNSAGCNCHSPTANPATAITVTGLPTEYTAGKSYDITVSSTTTVEAQASPINYGGFHLQANGGSFAARGNTQAAWVQATTGTNPTIEHTQAGEKGNAPSGGTHTWELTWTAPAKASGDVNFKLWVNRVNGNGSPDPADIWNTYTHASKAAKATGGNGGGSPSLGALAVLAAGLVGVALIVRRT